MPIRPVESAAVLLRAGACSHLGLHRARNEDAFLSRPGHGLFAVADGMGGHPAGDVASRLAIETLDQAIRSDFAGPPAEARAALAAAFADAHAALMEHALGEPAHTGLGTTLTAVLVRGTHAVVAHVGDSRLYVLRARELVQVTIDHTWVEREIAHGRLTRAAARRHPSSAVLLRVLGGTDVAPDLLDLPLHGSRLLLCSDGVSNMIEHDELSMIVAHDAAPAEIARRLCECADARGGHDNSTAVVVDVPPPVASEQART
jgi:protein phosphatase